MYDSISLALEYPARDIDYSGLAELRPVYDPNTRKVIGDKGKLKNLEVRVNENRIMIRGSLPKYFCGNNLRMLSLQEIKETFVRIGDELQIPIEQARAYQLDVAINVESKLRKNEFQPALGKNPRKYRKEYPFALLYNNSQRSITLYDKLKECKINEQALPAKLPDGVGILRIEVKLKKRLKNQINHKSPVYVRDIIENDMFLKLFALLKEEFFKIERVPKIEVVNPEIAPIKQKQISEFIITKFLLSGNNFEMLTAGLTLSKKAGIIKGDHYYRTINYLKKLVNTNLHIRISHAFQEIDEIVKNAQPLIEAPKGLQKYLYSSSR